MARKQPAHPQNYTVLDSDQLITTIERLCLRVGERFPQAGLYQVSRQLLAIANQSKERAATIARPLLWVRVLITLLIALVMVGMVGLVSAVNFQMGEFDVLELVQALEALINEVVFIGAGIFFLVTIEVRIKRRRALKALHELRAMAHVIDMHQLTKDPENMLQRDLDTPSSPKRTMTPYELSRYLDYCSEMLSLTGKLAALYIQNFDDGIVLSAVNEIETLTTDLSRKVWQKLMIIHGYSPQQEGKE
ncbi:MAG: hypothetical protein KF832_11545 [Caldilineaceae bacterium]|nr:hypothetical protein [Caldilineaceae bacterium]